MNNVFRFCSIVLNEISILWRTLCLHCALCYVGYNGINMLFLLVINVFSFFFLFKLLQFVYRCNQGVRCYFLKYFFFLEIKKKILHKKGFVFYPFNLYFLFPSLVSLFFLSGYSSSWIVDLSWCRKIPYGFSMIKCLWNRTQYRMPSLYIQFPTRCLHLEHIAKCCPNNFPSLWSKGTNK